MDFNLTEAFPDTSSACNSTSPPFFPVSQFTVYWTTSLIARLLGLQRWALMTSVPTCHWAFKTICVRSFSSHTWICSNFTGQNLDPSTACDWAHWNLPRINIAVLIFDAFQRRHQRQLTSNFAQRTQFSLRILISLIARCHLIVVQHICIVKLLLLLRQCR